jgi:hypothetical protein
VLSDIIGEQHSALGTFETCRACPHRPWDEKLGCQCGAGVPCECNQGDDQPDMSGIMDEQVTRH